MLVYMKKRGNSHVSLSFLTSPCMLSWEGQHQSAITSNSCFYSVHFISSTYHTGHSVVVQFQTVVHLFLCILYYLVLQWSGPPQSRYDVGVDYRSHTDKVDMCSSCCAGTCGSDTAVLLELLKTVHSLSTLTHHHHISVTSVLRKIHHPHHTCSVVVL